MIEKERGQVLLLVIVVMGVVLISIILLIGGAQLYYQNSLHKLEEEKALNLAEAGVDRAIVRLNNSSGTYVRDDNLPLGDGTVTIVVSDKDGKKNIESTGFIPNSEHPRTKKTIKIQAFRGIAVNLPYVIQTNTDGLTLGAGNTITGNIFSNSDINIGADTHITGDVWASGGSESVAEQQTDCSEGSCSDFIFGKVTDGESKIDAAQSFRPNTTGLINKVSVKLKKNGTPPNLTLRLTRDLNSHPDKNSVLAAVTIQASVVTETYGFVDVTFNAPPTLLASTTYWLVLDSGSDSSNYWDWQEDSVGSYIGGKASWSPDWSDALPTWNLINSDFSFKTYMGGSVTTIQGDSTVITGSAHANTLTNLNIGKDAYYQILNGSSVSGSSFANSNDPLPKPMPITPEMINTWKLESEANGSSGDISSCQGTLGPGKFSNVSFSSCTVTIKTPVWITGNLTLADSNSFTLSPEFGSTTGIIVVDGAATLENDNTFSNILVLSTKSGVDSAIKLTGTGNNGNFYASAGIIEGGNDNHFGKLIGFGVKDITNSTISDNLSSALFQSGVNGSYQLIRGTYQVR